MICQNSSCSNCGACITSCGCNNCCNNCAGNYPNPVWFNNPCPCGSGTTISSNINTSGGAFFVGSGRIEFGQNLTLNHVSSSMGIAYQNQGENAVISQGLYKIDYSAVVSGSESANIAIRINGVVVDESVIRGNISGESQNVFNTFIANIPENGYLEITNLNGESITINSVNVSITKLS